MNLRLETINPVSCRRRVPRRPIQLDCETLERRTVLSGSTVAIGFSATELKPASEHGHAPRIVHPAIGTISGTVTVTNGANQRGLAHVRVQLIDAQGDVVRTTLTNARGRYAFRVAENGAYVVRQITPRRFSQTAPTFTFTEATGSYATNPATGKPYDGSSYSYATGNSDPANGPVGPYAWDTVAPAGALPFGSPINIQAPATDLSPYLSIQYHTATPTAIVNNGHQLQVQFPTGNLSDTITVSGQVFHLAQFHYHDPSEHTIGHHGYTMEEHFVNTSASGAEAVVSVFFRLGAHNAALQPILDAATTDLTASGNQTTATSPIDLAGLLPTDLSGWFYAGSLTTPPLAQTVNWFVLATPITLDARQLKQYEEVAGGSGFLPNNRPIQPLDGRQINEFTFNVDFQNQSVSGLNFVNSRGPGFRTTRQVRPEEWPMEAEARHGFASVTLSTDHISPVS